MSPDLDDTPQTLVSDLTPAGHIVIHAGPDHGRALPAAAAQRIADAYAKSRGFGTLHLGVAELATDLDPTLGYWRDLGQSFVARVCATLDSTEPTLFGVPEPDIEELDAMAHAAPPMRGAELISSALLAEVWADMGVALTAEARKGKKGVQGYLEGHSSVWNVVGRVCFHLAENKRDREYPFAFIATYAHKVSKEAKVQHLPLHRALEEYAGAKNKKKLLALLSPLLRAAEESAFMRDLVDSGDVYHPLAWGPVEAHRFLSEVPVYEQAGVVVRVPDWWSIRDRPRPKVSVSVGGRAPSSLGMEAMLDFDVKLTLDGKALSKKEVEKLLASTRGLALIKGKWVEVDREKLSAVLEHWHDVQAQAAAGGVSFAEAMRMLAGADLAGPLGDGLADARPDWSEVVAGRWLTRKLDSLRSKDIRSEIKSGAGLDAELRPYQTAGVQWLWTLRALGLGACLADDMGLGKTIQVLGVMSMLRRKKVRGTDLLVVPASLVDNWHQEMQRFAPKLDALIAHPSRIPSARIKAMPASEVQSHDAVITTYGTVIRTPWMKEYRWRCVVLDEAQAIKNPGAKQTRAIKELDAEWRVALTGTPVENKLGDLWSIFDFLNPGLLGSAAEFNTFCKSLASRKHNAYAPLRRLVEPYILRRLKTDKSIISDLPDKTEVTAHCLLSKPQAALYQDSVKEMKRIIEEVEGIKRRGVVLAFLMRFKQICNHPSQWLGDHVYDASHSGKFARLRELGEAIAARQDKVLVFTQFREMTGPLANLLAEVFGRPGLVLHGGTAVKKRQALVRSFQENEDVPFMVLSLKAGGTGLNLTAASHVIHFDRWWNPAVENQATDRAFRIGQKKNVLVHKFVCKGTVEERIDQLIASKRELSDQILEGGAESALTEMNDDELLALVSLDLKSAVGA
ncbi:MAG: ATP-dependent helicase [Deltaproteobacteria bacterium]|nr:MAG: ATP-dependent helicase [Deltaproteobacteria bacterium]